MKFEYAILQTTKLTVKCASQHLSDASKELVTAAFNSLQVKGQAMNEPIKNIQKCNASIKKSHRALSNQQIQKSDAYNTVCNGQ